MTNVNARVILALAAEDDDAFIWDRLKVLQAEMFAAGAVQIKFAYYGREIKPPSRLFISTRWATDADDLLALMEHAQDNCRCGCYIDVADILEEALKETERGPLRAVVIIGDQFHTDSDHALALAKQLRAAGTRLFLFQQGRGRLGHATQAFVALAEVTGGAFFQFNPHVERLADRLPGMLEAVTYFAIGGVEALEAQTHTNASAALLLDQMANQEAAGRFMQKPYQ